MSGHDAPPLSGHHIDAVPIGGHESAEPECGTPDVAELMTRLRAAEAEVAQLREALASQRVIGVAIGILAHRFRCSPEQSWQLLVRLSQTSNVKVRELSRILVDAHAGHDVAADADVLAMVASQLPVGGQDLGLRTPKNGPEKDQ